MPSVSPRSMSGPSGPLEAGESMQYDEIARLRAQHPAWVMLRSDNAALVLSFLDRVFIERNASDLPASVLAGELDDELFALNQRLGEGRFPRSAAAYLDDWAAPGHGWLRKYYPPDSDEAHYDLAPAVEKALLWVQELRSRDFVGTESRLNTVFELLRQMVFGADEDPERRLVELRRRRAELDEEIARAERGDVAVLDAVSQRDRYQQFSRTARELLSDFREVEENFRRLDRRLREQIAGWTGSKGTLLDEALGSRNSIAESDQGRSFQAFYDFLLSHQRQTELTDLLERLAQIQHLPDQDERLNRIHFDWIDASERTQTTVRLLSEQLRRFLDDQVWLENRRVFDLLRGIETKALRVRHEQNPALAMELDDSGLTVNLPTERPLYHRRRATPIDSSSIQAGQDDFDSSALLSQMYVDRDELVQRVHTSLSRRDQVGLRELLTGEPLEQGLAELISYLSLREPGFVVVFDESRRERIEWSAEEVDRIAELPRVDFSRTRPAPEASHTAGPAPEAVNTAQPVPEATHTIRPAPGTRRSEIP
ncbi:MAG: Protein of uncharacterized function [Acidimicrobiaceae bacterium]|jgi:hypothetical protein|nr:Protein of uncharacterized function [Acidimicrobiaceae bacterium]